MSSRIARLIESNQVTSQPQLIELLAGDGIEATQATVSRDLDDIGAVKVKVPGGASVSGASEPEGWQALSSAAAIHGVIRVR